VSGIVYRDAALADGRSPRLLVGVSVLTENGRIAWIRPAEDEGELPPGCEVVDAGGCTIVPGLVDAHSHLTLLRVAESNGELQYRSGVRWARDVGSPRRTLDGRERALSVGVRDQWRGRRDRPYVRAAGTWISMPGVLPAGLPSWTPTSPG
jgi:imidazolonepropionase-like amidohydrolase